MSLRTVRMQIRKEITALMLEEGYSEQEIREQIDDLADDSFHPFF